MTENFVKELQWRGLLHDIIPGTEELMQKEKISGYIGFDPTSNSLHVGSLLPVIILVHLQKAGHTPVALVGGATGMVGDPSGKSDERNLLDEETLNKNLEGIKKQLTKFLNFDKNLPNAATLVNNFDWFNDFSFLNFIRDVGKFISVNYMMSKDSVKKRLEGEKGMSFTEFSYQLVQGYDFYYLYKNNNCKLQLGGSDQWGNIVTGTELIRKKAQGEAFAITCPLMTKSDGGKFGKSEKGNIWLDPEKTSPFEFYQFWLRSSDDDAKKWIKIFTFLKQSEIENLIQEHNIKPEDKLLQKTIAKEITLFVHDQEALNKAIETTETLFSKKELLFSEMTEQDLLALEGIVKVSYQKLHLENGIEILNLLTETNIFTSKGEARKMIIGGGLSVNGNKISDAQTIINNTFLLVNKFIVLQKGKKNFYLIELI